MNGEAKRCDECHRMTYGVERVAMLVAMQLRAERDLCAACRTNALDGFLQAQDGLGITAALAATPTASGGTATLASAPVASGGTAALASAPVATGGTAALASVPVATGATASLDATPVASGGAAGVGGTAPVDAPAYLVVGFIVKT